MADVRIIIRETFTKACELHRQVRMLAYESVMIVGKLHGYNAAVNLWMTDEEYFGKLGLTRDMYYKRCQAYNAIQIRPELGDWLKSGETFIAHLAMVGAKITAANSDIIAENIRGKTKRELQIFLASIDNEGNPNESEPTIEVKIMMTASELELLKRAQDILSSQGKNISIKLAIVQSLDILINKCDPIKKADRAKKRADEKKLREGSAHEQSTAPGQAVEKSAGKNRAQTPSKIGSTAPGQSNERRSIPAAVIHEIWLRDDGQCTYRSAAGQRCQEKRMIEVDHIVPVARKGGNTPENLQLHCRRHNQARADELFGVHWMAEKRSSAENLALS